MNATVVFCTCPNQNVAQEIAAALVNEQLAACVNILPALTSVYRWQEKIVFDQEVLLIIKSSDHLFTPLQQRIQQLHSYEVPEIISIAIQHGLPAYLEWLNHSLKVDHSQ